MLQGDGATAPQTDVAPAIAPFKRLPPETLATLRYRATDVINSLTPAAVRKARAADLKQEILNSTRLQVRIRRVFS